MVQVNSLWAKVMLVVLSLAGLITAYQVAFCVWMTAYPFAPITEWRARLYWRVATLLLIIFAWGYLALRIIRRRRSQES